MPKQAIVLIYCKIKYIKINNYIQLHFAVMCFQSTYCVKVSNVVFISNCCI